MRYWQLTWRYELAYHRNKTHLCFTRVIGVKNATFFFTALHIVCTWSFPSQSCSSVCPSQAWIVTKRTKLLPTLLHPIWKGNYSLLIGLISFVLVDGGVWTAQTYVHKCMRMLGLVNYSSCQQNSVCINILCKLSVCVVCYNFHKIDGEWVLWSREP